MSFVFSVKEHKAPLNTFLFWRNVSVTEKAREIVMIRNGEDIVCTLNSQLAQIMRFLKTNSIFADFTLYNDAWYLNFKSEEDLLFYKLKYGSEVHLLWQGTPDNDILMEPVLI